MKTTVKVFHLAFEVDEQAAEIVKLHLAQFIKNYRQCFGSYPSHQQLDGAFRFIDMFFKEVNETYPGSSIARPIQQLQFLVKSPAESIAERLAQLGCRREAPSAAVWYE